MMNRRTRLNMVEQIGATHRHPATNASDML